MPDITLDLLNALRAVRRDVKAISGYWTEGLDTSMQYADRAIRRYHAAQARQRRSLRSVHAIH
jgi:hypothetical protein